MQLNMVHEPTKLSFGSKLIKRLLPARFNGHADLNYDPDGFSFELFAPKTVQNFPDQWKKDIRTAYF